MPGSRNQALGSIALGHGVGIPVQAARYVGWAASFSSASWSRRVGGIGAGFGHRRLGSCGPARAVGQGCVGWLGSGAGAHGQRGRHPPPGLARAVALTLVSASRTKLWFGVWGRALPLTRGAGCRGVWGLRCRRCAGFLRVGVPGVGWVAPFVSAMQSPVLLSFA